MFPLICLIQKVLQIMEAAELAEAGIVKKSIVFGAFDFEKIPVAPDKKKVRRYQRIRSTLSTKRLNNRRLAILRILAIHQEHRLAGSYLQMPEKKPVHR